jgi:hypothetical protein
MPTRDPNPKKSIAREERDSREKKPRAYLDQASTPGNLSNYQQ